MNSRIRSICAPSIGTPVWMGRPRADGYPLSFTIASNAAFSSGITLSRDCRRSGMSRSPGSAGLGGRLRFEKSDRILEPCGSTNASMRRIGIVSTSRRNAPACATSRSRSGWRRCWPGRRSCWPTSSSGRTDVPGWSARSRRAWAAAFREVRRGGTATCLCGADRRARTSAERDRSGVHAHRRSGGRHMDRATRDEGLRRLPAGPCSSRRPPGRAGECRARGLAWRIWLGHTPRVRPSA